MLSPTINRPCLWSDFSPSVSIPYCFSQLKNEKSDNIRTHAYIQKDYCYPPVHLGLGLLGGWGVGRGDGAHDQKCFEDLSIQSLGFSTPRITSPTHPHKGVNKHFRTLFSHNFHSSLFCLEFKKGKPWEGCKPLALPFGVLLMILCIRWTTNGLCHLSQMTDMYCYIYGGLWTTYKFSFPHFYLKTCNTQNGKSQRSNINILTECDFFRILISMFKILIGMFKLPISIDLIYYNHFSSLLIGQDSHIWCAFGLQHCGLGHWHLDLLTYTVGGFSHWESFKKSKI